MDIYSGHINKLIEQLSRLPGVGAKSAQRLAFHIINMPQEEVDGLTNAITSAKANVRYCKECFTLTDEEICPICANKARDHSTIMVVEHTRDMAAYEKTGKYNGVYHVLNGLINIQKGILPENLNIQSLVNRINDDIEEVIIATDPTVEGETTALYITKLLDGRTKVTRLAHGIPMGGHLDYTDAHTLLKAFEGRK